MAHTNLYTVCATIIPVLLLTEALQADLYRRYIKEMTEPILAAPGHRRRRRWPKWVANSLAIWLIGSASVGEVVAIYALAFNHDSVNERAWVFWSTVTMFAIVALAITIDVLTRINRAESTTPT